MRVLDVRSGFTLTQGIPAIEQNWRNGSLAILRRVNFTWPQGDHYRETLKRYIQYKTLKRCVCWVRRPFKFCSGRQGCLPVIHNSFSHFWVRYLYLSKDTLFWQDTLEPVNGATLLWHVSQRFLSQEKIFVKLFCGFIMLQYCMWYMYEPCPCQLNWDFW